MLRDLRTPNARLVNSTMLWGYLRQCILSAVKVKPRGQLLHAKIQNGILIFEGKSNIALQYINLSKRKKNRLQYNISIRYEHTSFLNINFFFIFHKFFFHL